MQQKTPSKLKTVIVFTIFIVAFLSLLYYIGNSIVDNISLSKESRYTISTTVLWATHSNSKYSFVVNGKWYFGFTSKALHKDGTRYFIKYYPPNPWRNEATFVVADSNDIKNLAGEGYRELPHE